MKDDPRPTLITPQVLRRRLPLPQPREDDDKEARGRVLVVGGAPEMPGAVILAGEAALRAGAGKLRIATAKSIAGLVAASVPEARVYALPETKSGAISGGAVARLVEYVGEVHAVLFGPGMVDERAITRLMRSVLPHARSATVVLDADALSCLAEGRELLHSLGGRAVITPHAEEMATVCGRSPAEVARDPRGVARRVARELGAVVALKGRETFVAAPDGEVYVNRAGNVGLATSGSGDTLSGVIAGLAARRAEPLTAAAWGVYLHARAGDRLARRVGRLGFLARELLAEIPPLMSELSRGKR